MTGHTESVERTDGHAAFIHVPITALAPLTRYSVRSGDFGTLASIMEQAKPYQREHYRLPLPVSYPVMFFDAATIGEGLVTNLSVFGCTIECSNTLPEQTTLLLRLILPDQKESLPIEQAEVRWVKGKQVGLRFGQLERAANLRLHLFVWDRMIERLQSLKQECSPPSYS